MYRATALNFGSVKTDAKNQVAKSTELITSIDSTIAVFDKLTSRDFSVKIELVLLKGKKDPLFGPVQRLCVILKLSH